jgi:hypothetical protein
MTAVRGRPPRAEPELPGEWVLLNLRFSAPTDDSPNASQHHMHGARRPGMVGYRHVGERVS